MIPASAVSMLSRASRRFCTAVEANASIRAAAAKSWDKLIDAEWVDNDERIPEIREAEAVIDNYRAVYDGTQDDLYQKMADLYAAKEAAKAVELYADHIENVMRDHLDMTGLIGNETSIPEGEETRAVQMMREYIEFVNSVENDRIQRKVESQLGRKIIVIRQTLSIENFAVHFAPMACDRMVHDMPNEADTGGKVAAAQK